MKPTILILLGLSMALTACLPEPTTPVNLDDQVATSVGETLTAEAPVPTAPAPVTDTPPPSATEVPTLAPPTDTPSPSATASQTTPVIRTPSAIGSRWPAACRAVSFAWSVSPGTYSNTM